MFAQALHIGAECGALLPCFSELLPHVRDRSAYVKPWVSEEQPCWLTVEHTAQRVKASIRNEPAGLIVLDRADADPQLGGERSLRKLGGVTGGGDTLPHRLICRHPENLPVAQVFFVVLARTRMGFVFPFRPRPAWVSITDERRLNLGEW